MAGIQSGPSIGAIQSSQQAHGPGGDEAGSFKTNALTPISGLAEAGKIAQGQMAGLSAFGSAVQIKNAGLGADFGGGAIVSAIFQPRGEAFAHTMGAHSPYSEVQGVAAGLGEAGKATDEPRASLGSRFPDYTPSVGGRDEEPARGA